MITQPYLGLSNPAGDQWHAVYTRHQHEQTVAGHLTGRGIEVFLPVFETVRQWKDRKKKLSLPLFPCYVFFRSDLTRPLAILSTPGVYSIVGFGGKSASVEEREITAIRLAVESRLSIEAHPYLRCGDRVRVTTGPLSGVEGILIRKKSSFRLVISAELLEKSIAIEIDGFCVERVEPGAVVRTVALPASGSALSSGM